MKNLATYWTGAVAYLSLLVGAGLSVAGNLADTYRVRGNAVDAVDIALAIGPPLATLLMAELFVSQWPRAWSLQAVRWGGTITVGSLAMVVSWLHLSELLAARGQTMLVAILWPLAIDGLAIMAMAKLLAMRGHGQTVATHGQPVAMREPANWPANPAAGLAKEVESEVARLTEEMDKRWTDDGHGHEAADCPDVATPTDWDAELAKFDMAIDQTGQDVASAAEDILRPVATAPVVTGVPAEARELLAGWDATALPAADMEALLAAHFGKSGRTIRRWRSIVRPVPRDSYL